MELFIKELILKIYIFTLLTKVEIDILDFILSIYLTQLYKDGVQYLIIYYSYKIIPLKLNYNIYNKELLKIIIVFKE